MKNCFGYVRVSSHKQGEGVSLEAQKDAILRFASANDIAISQWFEEQQTAAKSGRPVFNAMLKSLKAGKAAGVVMHRIDRSARNFFDWARIGELADSGIDVHFATESLDFRSRGGRLTANIQMAVAEDYVRNLKAEIHKGQRGQLERGLYPFKAPIGYRNNGANALKTIDPVCGPLVKLAFELYASGQYSLHSLRGEMARRGLSRRSGEPMSKCCFEKFLANPFYTGIIRIGKTGEIYQGAHEPLVSATLFRQVADVRAGKSGKKVTRHQHLFRGLFRCANCAHSMIPEKQKAYVYYRCQSPECRGNSVREEPLSAAIATALEAGRFSDEHIAIVCRRVEEWQLRTDQSSGSQTHAMQIAQIDERLTKLEDAAIDRIIDATSFAARKEKLLLERAQAVEESERAAKNRVAPERMRRFLERVKNLAQHYQFADPADKRVIAEIATSNRIVANKNVRVEPSDWLQTAHDSVAVLSCAQSRTTSRTSPHIPDRPVIREKRCKPRACSVPVDSAGDHIERLIEVASSPTVGRVGDMLVRDLRDSADGKSDFNTNDNGL